MHIYLFMWVKSLIDWMKPFFVNTVFPLRITIIQILGIIMAAFLFSNCTSQSRSEKHRIVVIHSYDSHYKGYKNLDKMIEKDFKKAHTSVELKTFYLDCEKYNEQQELLRMKQMRNSLKTNAFYRCRSMRAMPILFVRKIIGSISIRGFMPLTRWKIRRYILTILWTIISALKTKPDSGRIFSWLAKMKAKSLPVSSDAVSKMMIMSGGSSAIDTIQKELASAFAWMWRM